MTAMAIIRYNIKSLLYKLACITGWTTVCRSSWLRILPLATQEFIISYDLYPWRNTPLSYANMREKLCC
jgi:hypothetical protein